MLFGSGADELDGMCLLDVFTFAPGSSFQRVTLLCLPQLSKKVKRKKNPPRRTSRSRPEACNC